MGPKLEDFKVLSTIGKGSHGTVRKVRRLSDGQILVWKELNYGSMTEAEKQGLVLEVNLLRELHHPHIVRFLHHIVCRRTTTLYILMEHCPGGDLKQLVHKCKKTGSFLPEDFIWRVLKQICEALKTCHTHTPPPPPQSPPPPPRSKVILHRDIKPANVFLGPSGEVKLGDFGLARTLNSETSFASSVVGTPYYMSPEVIEGQEYNDKSDMWSLGCLVYELCALQPPFLAPTHALLAAKIKQARYPPIPVHYSSELQQLLNDLLTYKHFMRPSALMLLHHPSLTSRFPPLSHSLSLSLSIAGGKEEEEEKKEEVKSKEDDEEIPTNEEEKEEKQEETRLTPPTVTQNTPNFPSLPHAPHTCATTTDTTPGTTHFSSTYHIPTTPLETQGGFGGGCFCKGMTETDWREYVVSIREKEVLVREREIAVREREREISERERRVVGLEREVSGRERRVIAMEKEAREHLIRAQIFLKNTRNRKVSKDDAADGKWQADTETEGKIEKNFTSRRELNEESDVQGCPKFERQESNFRAQTETDFHPKLDQNFPSKTEPNFHLKPDMKTEENPINQNEKTTKHDLTFQNTTPMTLQPLQRPDTDSDLDTTLSAGLDETEKVTTARPDPAVLRNPFLEMRSGHMKQVTFMGIGNKSGFKSNTLDNPKSRKKMDCVFVLREDHAGQDVRSKVMCEVEGGEKDQAIKVKRSDLNAKLLENGDKFSDFKLRRSLSELKGTDGREKGQEIKVKRSVSNPKPTEKKEKVTEIRLTEKTNTMGQESRMKRSDSNIKRDSKFKRSYLGAMRGLLRDKENQCEGPAVPNLKKPLVTQKAKGTLAGPRVLQYYNVV